LAAIDSLVGLTGKGAKPRGQSEGLLRGIVVRASTSSGYMDAFYREQERLEQDYSEWQAGTKIPKEVEVARLDLARQVSAALAGSRRYRRAVMGLPGLTSQERRKAIDSALGGETDLVAAFLGRKSPSWAEGKPLQAATPEEVRGVGR